MRTSVRAIATICLMASAIGSEAHAQATATTGSPNCTVITQSAADAVAARIQGDDANIKDPVSVKNLTCLDSFFNGFGLNVVANLIDPATLLATVEGKICSLVSSTLSSLAGSAQCGLTITGFNIGGFGSLGGGNFCPKLSFGGGGPTWGTFGVGSVATGGGGFTVNGAGLPPTGYPLQPNTSAY